MKKILILMITVLLTYGVTGAQDVPATFCGDLSADDCNLLTQSAEAMSELESAAFQFDMGFSIAGIQDVRPDSISFRLGGYGSYAVEPGLLSAITMSTAEMMQNFSQLSQLLEDTLQGISADVTLILFFPDDLMQLASKEGTQLPSKAGLSLRLVDGIGYVNLNKLMELDTENELPRGWIGIDLVELFNRAVEESGLEDDMVMPGFDSESMNLFSDPDIMASFMSIERLEDGDIDGQPTAVFQTSIDLGALYASPEYQAMLREQMEANAEEFGGTGMSDEDFEEIISLYTTLFDGFVIDMTQIIGLDDHYIHEMNIDFDWSIDFSQMFEGFGEMDATVSSQPIDVSFDFQMQLSQFNNAPVITAPEDVQMIPLDGLFGDDMDAIFSLFSR